MKLRSLHFGAWLICATILGLNQALALDVGETAPAIQVSKWIKGGPIDFERGRGSNVFVIDFWSTICLPCRYSIPFLTDMQKKYRDRGVVIVGISAEDASTVKNDISRMEPPVGYAIAVDAGEKTSNAYLKGAGWDELPHAFVIDKDGKLVWHGNSTVALDQVLEEVLAGKLGLDDARRTLVAEKAIRDYYRIASTGKTNSRLAELGEQILANATKYPTILNEFAWRILTDRNVRTKDYKLALRASRIAYEQIGDRVPVMDTYARALFQNGNHAEAIAMESKAIEACSDSHVRPELEAIRHRFERLSAPKK